QRCVEIGERQGLGDGLSSGALARAVATRRSQLPGTHLRGGGLARGARRVPQGRLAVCRRSAVDVRHIFGQHKHRSSTSFVVDLALDCRYLAYSAAGRPVALECLAIVRQVVL
ncbi:unnamed protein product, partial [Ectocarpus fasciculatus]